MSALRDQTEPVGIFRELARTTWGKAHEAGEAWARADAECPPARVPTLADMAAWTADGATEDGATEAARTEAAERLTALVLPDWQDARGKGAGAMIGPSHPIGEPAPAGPWHVVPDRVDMAETQRYLLVTGLTRPSMATVAAPSLALYGRLVADAHRRWPGGPHPLAPLMVAWQAWKAAQGDPPDKVHVLVKQERRPPPTTEPLRLARMPGLLALMQAPLEAVEVDGEPLVSATPDARCRYRVLPPGQGELFPAPRTLDKRATGGALVEAVASVPLGGDERNPIRADLLRIGTLAYALTGSVRLTPGETSTLIVGSDTPQGREQALTLVWLMRGMAIAPAGEPWAAFDAEPGAVHRIGPPRWWLDETGPRAYRLVGALFRRIPGEGRKAARWGSLERTLSGIEGALLWGPAAGKGRGGRLPDAVRPVRRGGPGPKVRIPWHRVLRVSGEHVTPEMLADRTATDRLNKRYQRRVDALQAAGYFVPHTNGAAPAGDTIEIVARVKGGRHHEAAIVVRATARFCAAYATGAEQTRLPASHLLMP